MLVALLIVQCIQGRLHSKTFSLLVPHNCTSGATNMKAKYYVIAMIKAKATALDFLKILVFTESNENNIIIQNRKA